MINSAAENARNAIHDRQFRDADAILSEALRSDPRNSDLLCERAILFCYVGREAEALAMLSACEGAARLKRLEQILCEHAYCRQLAAPNDKSISETFRNLRARYEGSLDQVGLKISACLITKDETANLDRCLRSLVDVVDEIIVVDTGSTDDTVEIAKHYGAKIGDFPWCQDFAAARNHALELATGHWALWIDADEEITPETKAAFERARVRPHFGGFDIEIVNYTSAEGEAESFVHCPTRLFRLLPEVRFEGRIHEQVTPSLIAIDLPWTRLEGARILHHGYRPQAMAEKNKLDRTIFMLEREVREAPRQPFHWFNLANALLIAKRFTEGEHAGKCCVRLMPAKTHYGRFAYQILAQCQSGAGRPEDALLTCDEATKRGFGGLLVEFERAGALMNAGRLEEALDAIDRCLELKWEASETGDRGIADFKRLVVRGQILALLTRYEEAIAMFDQAIQVCPTFAPTLYSRAATLEKIGELDQALADYRQIEHCADTRLLALKGIGRIMTAMERHRDASEAFSAAWHASPEDYESWVGWAKACESWGNVSALVAAYEAFAKLHEPSVEILINWGRALDASGNAERALHCFVEALRREPDCANAYFNCGDLLYREGHVQDAAHLYESGLRYDPSNAEGWFTLGNCLARMGLAEGAAKSYLQVLGLNPGHTRAQHNLEIVSEPLAA